METVGFCVSSRHRSDTKSTETDITKTRQDFFIRQYVLCNRRKSMIFSDHTIEAERLGKYF